MNALESLLDELTYKPGWTFKLGTENYEKVLKIEARCQNSGGRFARPDGSPILVTHTFPMSWAVEGIVTRDHNEAMRFVLDCIQKMELHEAMEFFTVGDPECGGGKPFFPYHGPLDEGDSYAIPTPWSAK